MEKEEIIHRTCTTCDIWLAHKYPCGWKQWGDCIHNNYKYHTKNKGNER